MKNQILWAVALIYLCTSCSPKPAEQTYSMVGPSLSHEITTMWIAPQLGGTLHMPAGIMTTEDCYKIDSRSRLMQDAESVKKHFESSHSNQEFLCHPIEGFDYQEGYVYQIEVHKQYVGTKLENVSLERVLFSEIDQTFAKEETVVMWIHNQIQSASGGKIRSNASHDQNAKILVQYGKTLDLNGEFTPIDIPTGYQHNSKYITQVSVKRNHISVQNESNYDDTHQSFNDTFQEELKKLVGDQESWPSSIVDSPTIAYAKMRRKTIRTSYSKSSKSYVTSSTSNQSASKSNRNISRTDSDTNQEEGVITLSDSPSYEIAEMWVGSKRNGEDSYSDENGHYSFSDCYVITYKGLPRNETLPYGTNEFSFPENIESLCMDIEGFDYEPGYIYKIEVTKTYSSVGLHSVHLNKIISKEEDIHYVKEEIFDVWIDAERTQCMSLFGTEYECLKTQFSEKIDPNKWSGHDYIGGIEPKLGYVYHIKMKRTHLSKFELSMIADHPGFGDSMVEILEMYKKPVKQNTTTVSNNNDNKGFTSKTTRTTKRWSTKKRTVKSSMESSAKRKTSSSFRTGKTKNSTSLENADAAQPISMVSPNPPSFEIATIWIASERNGEIKTHSDVGVSVLGDCYKFAYVNDIKISSSEIEYDVARQITKPLCLEIEGFEFEPGYIYKMDVTKGYLGEELTSVTMNKLNYKIEDPYFEKVEQKEMWIGPNKKILRGMHGNEYESMQAQYGKDFNGNGEWDYVSYIEGFEHKPGFLYKVKVTITYASKEDTKTMSHPIYRKFKLDKVLSKRKI